MPIDVSFYSLVVFVIDCIAYSAWLRRPKPEHPNGTKFCLKPRGIELALNSYVRTRNPIFVFRKDNQGRKNLCRMWTPRERDWLFLIPRIFTHEVPFIPRERTKRNRKRSIYHPVWHYGSQKHERSDNTVISIHSFCSHCWHNFLDGSRSVSYHPHQQHHQQLHNRIIRSQKNNNAEET